MLIPAWTTSFVEFTSEPKTISERPDWKASDGEAEVGYGVQRLPGVCRRVHEHAGKIYWF